MSWLQIVCIILLLYGALSGWRNGLVKEICSSIGFILGLFVAYYCYSHFGIGIGWALVLIIAFPFGLGVVTTIFSKALDHVFAVGKLNRVLGAVVGFIKCGLVVYCIQRAAETVEGWKNLLF